MYIAKNTLYFCVSRGVPCTYRKFSVLDFRFGTHVYRTNHFFFSGIHTINAVLTLFDVARHIAIYYTPHGAFPLQRQICAQYRWRRYNANALGHVKYREEYVSKNNVYSLFTFHLLLFTAIDCRLAFFSRYLHKVEEWPNFLTLSAALNAFSAPLSIP